MNTQSLYNTPVEVAIRLLIILEQSKEQQDLEWLLLVEHFSLHTSDVGIILESIHAPVPNRGVQLYAKEKVVKLALNFLLSKGLIDVKFTNKGFVYKSNDISLLFLNYFESNYFTKFQERVHLVLLKFSNYNTKEMKKYFEDNVLELQK